MSFKALRCYFKLTPENFQTVMLLIFQTIIWIFKIKDSFNGQWRCGIYLHFAFVPPYRKNEFKENREELGIWEYRNNEFTWKLNSRTRSTLILSHFTKFKTPSLMPLGLFLSTLGIFCIPALSLFMLCSEGDSVISLLL